MCTICCHRKLAHFYWKYLPFYFISSAKCVAVKANPFILFIKLKLLIAFDSSQHRQKNTNELCEILLRLIIRSKMHLKHKHTEKLTANCYFGRNILAFAVSINLCEAFLLQLRNISQKKLRNIPPIVTQHFSYSYITFSLQLSNISPIVT